MKKLYSKTIKIGRLSTTILPDELILIVNGTKTRILNIKKPEKIFNNIKILSIAACLITCCLFFIFYPSGGDIIDNDDIQKNKLLLSSKTDYSTPEKKIHLKVNTYTVVRGDTLSHIAKKYGVSMGTICGTNNLRSYDLIREGTVLKIPNKDGILYKIKKGNKIVSISKKYKIPIHKILSENNLKNPDFVSVGTLVFIPDAKPQNIVTGFMWPAGRIITCGYGWRRNPYNRRHREFHHGLDIRARYSWIRSSKYGKITYTGWLGGYGKTVIIAHPGGWKTLYAHLSRIIVRKGQYVKQGQTIARSGNTGRSTGPHLHFEIIKRGRHKNPYYYLKR